MRDWFCTVCQWRGRKGPAAAAFLLLLGINLCACQKKKTSSMADYIGIEAAKETAFRAAGVSGNEADVSAAGLDCREGIFYYQVVFTENGKEYEYAIDALTGLVIEERLPGEGESESETGGVILDERVLETETGGVILDERALETEASTSMGANQPLTADQALSIALSHAGLTGQDIGFQKVKQDEEHSIAVFEVEFTTLNGVEYDYEISQSDGSILSFDYDAEGSLKWDSVEAGSGIISEEEAKKTVLSYVPGADATHIFMKLDEDDGRLEYEGELFYDGMKYEFKIDAYRGYLIEWEAEKN